MKRKGTHACVDINNNLICDVNEEKKLFKLKDVIGKFLLIFANKWMCHFSYVPPLE